LRDPKSARPVKALGMGKKSARFGRRPLQREEGGLKPPLQRKEKRPASEGGPYKSKIGDELAGDLLGLELAVEGFENPGLEDVAVAWLYLAVEEAEAGGASVEDDGFGFEGLAFIVNLEQDAVLFFERGGGFEETAQQA